MPKAKIAESEAAKLGLKYEDHPLIKIVPDARRNSANPAAN